MKVTKTVAIIGSGVSGLTAAATIAAAGHIVTVIEKNAQPGGRLRHFKESGFTFDMGPSWYWMPDVFEKYFNKFDYSTVDFYKLVRLDPGFQIIYGDSQTLKIPSEWSQLLELFESIERGAADQLKKFMQGAEYKYQVGINELVYKPGLSFIELLTPQTIKGVFKLQLFSSFSKHVRKYFTDKRLISLMEFPILFLGAMPKDTPALYSLMNYSGLKHGTFYPMGGFKTIVEALTRIAKEKGAEFLLSEPVTAIEGKNERFSVQTEKRCINVNGLIASADYHHVEANLLPPSICNYDKDYWESRTLSPSCLLFYVGVNKKIEKLEHHNLFFDEDFDQHSVDIYKSPKWPDRPLFYVCCPSKTDPSVAPEGNENLFILMPIAAGLEDIQTIRDDYFERLIKRLEKFTQTELKNNIVYKRSYCVNDFIEDYNSYKGNAYGLANTLRQTANLKPKIKNKHLKHFYYSGHLTVPGPGVPPAIISGQIAANELLRSLNR